ncbi:MAG: type II toxin-antitoxin system VapC family toxin, partial [Conexibacteraceae bacterium]|nr:type II toxin-antitoxin system VapC family toxin [Conexibacteraceae bacterium]
MISEIRRGRDPNVQAWISKVDDVDLHLSVMTLGEIRKGIELLRSHDPHQAEVFANWLGDLRVRFADRIVAIDTRIAEEWGRLNAVATRNTVDSLIAASARIHDLTVVTRNIAD